MLQKKVFNRITTSRWLVEICEGLGGVCRSIVGILSSVRFVAISFRSQHCFNALSLTGIYPKLLKGLLSGSFFLFLLVFLL